MVDLKLGALCTLANTGEEARAERSNKRPMQADRVTARASTGERTPSSRTRKDSKSPGGPQQDKRAYDSQAKLEVKAKAKARRGRSGNRVAAYDHALSIASMAEDNAKADEEMRQEEEHTTDSSEDGKDTVCGFSFHISYSKLSGDGLAHAGDGNGKGKG